MLHSLLKKLSLSLLIMEILPRDVIKIIVSHLDIDSRRALGIYTKLIIPEYLAKKIKFKPIVVEGGSYSVQPFRHYKIIHKLTFTWWSYESIFREDYKYYNRRLIRNLYGC